MWTRVEYDTQRFNPKDLIPKYANFISKIFSHGFGASFNGDDLQIL